MPILQNLKGQWPIILHPFIVLRFFSINCFIKCTLLLNFVEVFVLHILYIVHSFFPLISNLVKYPGTISKNFPIIFSFVMYLPFDFKVSGFNAIKKLVQEQDYKIETIVFNNVIGLAGGHQCSNLLYLFILYS